MQVSVSILKKIDDVENAINQLNETTCDYIHLDVMDGTFVPHKSFTFTNIKQNLKNNQKPLDVHLMVNNPEKYIERYSRLNPEYITVHFEVLQNFKVFHEIKKNKIKRGISINPDTPIEKIFSILDKVNLVLIMSVNPGAGGQKFIEDSILKIKQLKKVIKERELSVLIAVDGGINEETAILCKKAGADIACCGNYITKEKNYQKPITKIQEI